MIAPWDVGTWVVNTIEDALNNLQDIVNNIKNIVTTGGVPVVRHIQRGTVSTNYDYEAPVTLSGFTNKAKMMVIFNGIYATGGNNGDVEAYTPYIASISATQVTFKFPENLFGLRISYQVIEFY